MHSPDSVSAVHDYRMEVLSAILLAFIDCGTPMGVCWLWVCVRTIAQLHQALLHLPSVGGTGREIVGTIVLHSVVMMRSCLFV